jgi:RimJ/RimL family protein N-acetyltransferase
MDADPRPLARTSPPFEPRPVTLAGRLVRLEPLGERHRAGLLEVAFDPETWRWTRERVRDAADFDAYLGRARAAAEAGREVPFAQLEASTGRPIGMTRFLAIERSHRRLEIGFTWLARAWRQRGFNAEAKLLLMSHAFDELGAHRVEFKTDANNTAARAALRAIGATEEGTFRRHVVTDAGRVRDSVYFSVIWDEWPAVRSHLEALVAAMAELEDPAPASGSAAPPAVCPEERRPGG